MRRGHLFRERETSAVLRASQLPNLLAAEANLWAAVRRDAVPGGTIFLSRLHEALSLTEKEEDHVILSPTANVTPETGHIVVPGNIEWVKE